MSNKKENIPFINREISWLSFNERVLQEAEDPTVPVIERMRFLGIFSNNRDEFFRVRVASVKRMMKHEKKAKELLGEDPAALLEQIQQIVIDQQHRFDEAYEQILKELEMQKIFIINEKSLTEEQGNFVKEHFRANVMPALVPIMIDNSRPFPSLKDKSSYLIIKLSRKRKEKKSKYALLEVPSRMVNRFIVLPSIQDKKYIILLDDVIRYCLDEIFSIFYYDEAEAYTIKMTRDAELDIDNDISKSLVEKITGSLKKRKKGQPVRLVYDSEISKDMLAFVMKQIRIRKEDNPIPGGRYHNFKDFMNFPSIGGPELRYQQLPAINHRELDHRRGLLSVIRKKDILLSYPYQSYHHVTDIIREASIDPKVHSIKITIYRLAQNSNIGNALVNAIKNGKEVTVVVELQARFDEENNIYWANKLFEEGAKVIYGVPGLKVHSKLFLISRKEQGRLVNYAHIGTGNFNEATAKVYTDHSLLTSDKRITEEVEKLFEFYGDNLKVNIFKHIIVSPFYMRRRFLQLLNREITNAKQGRQAYIILKMNSLVDRELIKKLYEASCAGVKIRLIIRGICSLVTGVKDLSENIEAISIVDKYLEHSRVFIFCNGGDEKYFISSGDWMSRNIDYRSEVATPLYDKSVQREIRDIVELQWKDNTKARILNNLQDNQYKRNDSVIKVRAQTEIYNYIKQQHSRKENLDNLQLIEIRSN